MSWIGLCGSHRVGKTTLARDFAAKSGAIFLETSVSEIFKKLGVSPSDTFDFKTRLDIQERVLTEIDAMYAKISPGTFVITDRTPIDMLAYTMAEAIGDLVAPEDQVRFEKYTARCFDVVNRRFSSVLLVQPGIPMIDAPGKAALNRSYIEHLNSLMLGLLTDERMTAANYYLRRSYVDKEVRVLAVERAVEATHLTLKNTLARHAEKGMRIH